jgi:hypothetical protein
MTDPSREPAPEGSDPVRRSTGGRWRRVVASVVLAWGLMVALEPATPDAASDGRTSGHGAVPAEEVVYVDAVASGPPVTTDNEHVPHSLGPGSLPV